MSNTNIYWPAWHCDHCGKPTTPLRMQPIGWKRMMVCQRCFRRLTNTPKETA